VVAMRMLAMRMVCDLDGCDQVGCDEDGCSEEDVDCCGVNIYSRVRNSRNLNCALHEW
jgi:hypothetical protein